MRARGHRVTLITNEHFAGLAAKAGLRFIPLGTEAEFERTINNPDLWKPLAGFRLVMGTLTKLIEPLLAILKDEYVADETVMAAQVTAFGARIAHESLHAPLVTVHLQPSVIMSTIDPPEVPLAALMRKLPMWGRRVLLSTTGRFMVDPLLAPPINAARRSHGLKPVREIMHWWHSPQSVLCLFPEWFAPPQPDWPPHVHLTGFPLFDEKAQHDSDPSLEEFLNAGSSPIVFTAGSAMRHGHEFFECAVAACEGLNRRGILLARFNEQIPARLPETVKHFTYVPFSELLPRAAALAHHGGIGTTAQALAAGIPQLVMPLAHDQPDNAMRLKRFGVGATLPPKHFKPDAVRDRLRALIDNPKVATRAQALAKRIREADAIDDACRVIEAALASRLDSAKAGV